MTSNYGHVAYTEYMPTAKKNGVDVYLYVRCTPGRPASQLDIWLAFHDSQRMASLLRKLYPPAEFVHFRTHGINL